jgi:hypothetical protein
MRFSGHAGHAVSHADAEGLRSRGPVVAQPAAPPRMHPQSPTRLGVFRLGLISATPASFLRSLSSRFVPGAFGLSSPKDEGCLCLIEKSLYELEVGGPRAGCWHCSSGSVTGSQSSLQQTRSNRSQQHLPHPRDKYSFCEGLAMWGVFAQLQCVEEKQENHSVQLGRCRCRKSFTRWCAS